MLIIALAALAAASPVQIQHQGRLLDSVGTPVEGQQTVSVALYADSSSSLALWSEAQTVETNGGYYALVLGADTVGNPLDGSLFGGANLFVEVSIGGGTSLGRQPVMAVPTAVHATTLSGGAVDATEVRVGGELVINSSGEIVSSALGNGGPLSLPAGSTIGGLGLTETQNWTGTTGTTVLQIGNTLIQAGIQTCASTGSVTFPVAFGQRPSVTAHQFRTANSTDDNVLFIGDLQTTRFDYRIFDYDNSVAEGCDSGEFMSWQAIGVAP